MADCIKKTWKIIAAVLIGLIIIWLMGGCTGMAGKVDNALTELKTSLKMVKEDVDKSSKNYGDITGQLTAIENRVSIMQSTVNNISNQIKNTTNNGIPFWQLSVVVLIIFWFRYRDARASSRNPVKHFLGVKDKK